MIKGSSTTEAIQHSTKMQFVSDGGASIALHVYGGDRAEAMEFLSEVSAWMAERLRSNRPVEPDRARLNLQSDVR